MRSIRLFALVFLCVLALGAPTLVQASGYAGEATNIINGVCYWSCYNGTGGSAPVSRPGVGQKCLNLCAGACGGPCLALY